MPVKKAHLLSNPKSLEILPSIFPDLNCVLEAKFIDSFNISVNILLLLVLTSFRVNFLAPKPSFLEAL